MSRWDAAVAAARTRLRPILMTSFAFILGVLPLVLAEGPGAEMRQSLGAAVFFGMIGVTVFGLLFTPVFYVVCRGIASRMPQTPAAPSVTPTTGYPDDHGASSHQPSPALNAPRTGDVA